ncbi:MAG: ribonuclease Z [Spirochaetia bacterium]
MEAFILGTSGMVPLPNRHLTSMLLRREGALFLFDCGEGTQVSLKRLNLRWKKIDAIFISHTHADHVTGLPGILMLSSQVDRSDPLYIIGPPKIKEYIHAMISTLDMYINYQIIVQEIDPTQPQTVFEAKDGSYFVKSFPLKHSKPCVGYVFEERPRAGEFFPEQAQNLGIPCGPMWAKLQSGVSIELNNKIISPCDVMGPPRSGRKVCFVTDTLYIPSIAEHVAKSDLLICEGMFTEEFLSTATEKKHLTAKQAAQIAKDAAVKKMGLIHYSPRYTDRQLKYLLLEAESIFSRSFLCRDRLILEIPYEH